MFSQVSVCPHRDLVSVCGGLCQGDPPDRYPLDRDHPGQRPPGQRPTWIETPLDRDPLIQIPPSGQRPFRQRPPGQTLPQTGTPLNRDPQTETLPEQRTPLGQRPPRQRPHIRLGVVRILLESILVY